MLKLHLQKRYKVANYRKLAYRVSDKLGRTAKYKKTYFDLIYNKKMIPAGNTLLAGINPIMPNCSILPTVTKSNLNFLLKKATNLWSKRVGIGFDLSKSENPVEILKILSKSNDSIELGHRPKRGNMAVLNIKHPQLKNFISCKLKNKDLYNFNLSIVVEGEEGDLSNYKKELELISQSAWASGDPGIIFLDRIRNNVPYDFPNDDLNNVLKPIETVVPCGEQGMHPYEICTLGSINLANLVGEKGYLDEDSFRSIVRSSVDMLDDAFELIDFDYLGDSNIKEVANYTKRLGLGLMGFADLLENLNIRYNEVEKIKPLVDKIGKIFKEESHNRSREIAKEQNYNFNDRRGRKHLTVTCIAPTGGITLLTENKGFAIEPFFEEAHDLSYKNHIQVQSMWQPHIDNAISKTINLPYSATVEDVYKSYVLAYRMGCKSITVYRDRTHKNQPIKCESCYSPGGEEFGKENKRKTKLLKK